MRKFTDWLRTETAKREAEAHATDQLIKLQAETVRYVPNPRPLGAISFPYPASNDAEAIQRLFRQSGFSGESPASQEGDS